jgi:hypothetical protein
MSSSNAAAIRRRAAPSVTPPTSAPQKKTANNISSPTAAASQMTLQQVIATVDKRLTQLEQFAKTGNPIDTGNTTNPDISLVVEEFNNRFEMIVTEINSLKDVVMKLQTYTMDVNKMLVDERIHILSDTGNNSMSSSIVNTQDVDDTLTSANVQHMVEQELHDNNK